MTVPFSWVELHRQLPAASIDPFTQREIERHTLPAGAAVENAHVAVKWAAARAVEFVNVQARHTNGRVSFERVAAADLREAIDSSPRASRTT
jgi:hypothetical protein